MYIIYPCTKDTYITNKSYLGTDGKYSNFGRSSTIDLYKTYNENSQIKQQAILKLLDIPNDQSEFKFKNYLDFEYIFRFDTNTDISGPDPNQLEQNNSLRILIGIQNLETIEEVIEKIKNVINTPYKNIIVDTHPSSGLISIIQDKSGYIKETNIEINISDIDTNLEVIQNFSRIEQSIGLLYFDLEKNNKYFSFEKIKDSCQINLSLKDVTSGISKPRDYILQVLPLTKYFNEGIGRDVYNLKDIDSANFILSNYNGQTNQKYYWETSGSLGLIQKSGSN